MIIAATGHRPDKLGGYGAGVLIKLQRLAEEYLKEAKPDRVISGMAQGWDTAIAVAALQLKIPLICAVPFDGQEKMWPPGGQKRYHNILKAAYEVKVVSPGGYEARKMHTRNEWMVINCDRLVALFDGSAGGTYACIQFALWQKRPVDNLWEKWEQLL